MRREDNWETHSVLSYRSDPVFNQTPPAQPLPPSGQNPPIYTEQPMIETSRAAYQSSAKTDLMRRRSIQSNRSGHSVKSEKASSLIQPNSTPQFPSDEELLNEIRHILSTSDLMTITKKQVRQQLGSFFGVDMTPKKEYIHACIDGILKGEL
jgi:chitin synthase